MLKLQAPQNRNDGYNEVAYVQSITGYAPSKELVPKDRAGKPTAWMNSVVAALDSNGRNSKTKVEETTSLKIDLETAETKENTLDQIEKHLGLNDKRYYVLREELEEYTTNVRADYAAKELNYEGSDDYHRIQNMHRLIDTAENNNILSTYNNNDGGILDLDRFDQRISLKMKQKEMRLSLEALRKNYRENTSADIKKKTEEVFDLLVKNIIDSGMFKKSQIDKIGGEKPFLTKLSGAATI